MLAFVGGGDRSVRAETGVGLRLCLRPQGEKGVPGPIVEEFVGGGGPALRYPTGIGLTADHLRKPAPLPPLAEGHICRTSPGSTRRSLALYPMEMLGSSRRGQSGRNPRRALAAGEVFKHTGWVLTRRRVIYRHLRVGPVT